MKYQDKYAQKAYDFAQECRMQAEKISGEKKEDLLNAALISEKTADIYEQARHIEEDNRIKYSKLIVKILKISSN